MNLPNTLTILRIFFVPFLVAVLVEQDLRIDWHGVFVANEFLALAIFLAAAMALGRDSAASASSNNDCRCRLLSST